ASQAQPGGDRDRGRGADRAQPRRNPPAPSTALGGRARLAARVALGPQRGRQSSASSSLTPARFGSPAGRLRVSDHYLVTGSSLQGPQPVFGRWTSDDRPPQ